MSSDIAPRNNGVKTVAGQDGNGHRLPILIRADEVIGIKRAIEKTGRSDDTIRRWIDRYGIARQSQPGAPYEISIIGLWMALHGDAPAIELLRAGQREHPSVVRYFNELGIAP